MWRAVRQLCHSARYIDLIEFFSMHVKCVITDRHHTLIGSANFTNRAHTRNLEIGVLLHDDPEFTETLAEHFEGLVKQQNF